MKTQQKRLEAVSRDSAGRETALMQRLKEVEAARQAAAELVLKLEERLRNCEAQLIHARQQLDLQASERTAREQAYSQRLAKARLAAESEKSEFERQLGIREHEYSAQLNSYVVELGLTRRRVELQIEEMRKQSDDKLRDARRHFEALLDDTRQENESQLKAQVEMREAELADLETRFRNRLQLREKVYAAQIGEMHHQLKAQYDEQIERERQLELVIRQAQRELQTLQRQHHYHEALYKAECAALKDLIRSMHESQAWMNASPFRRIVQRIKGHQQIAFDGVQAAQAMLGLPRAESGSGDVAGLLMQDGEEFVRRAYIRILGREPDTEGLQYYSMRLKQGITKVEVLCQLSLSAEGRVRNVRLDGLEEHIKHYRLRKVPIFGAFIGRKLLPRTYVELQDSNGSRQVEAITNDVSKKAVAHSGPSVAEHKRISQ